MVACSRCGLKHLNSTISFNPYSKPIHWRPALSIYLNQGRRDRVTPPYSHNEWWGLNLLPGYLPQNLLSYILTATE